MQFRPDGRQAIEVDTSGNILVRNAITGKVHEFIKRAPNLKDFGGGPPNLTAVDAACQVVAVASPRGVVVTSIATRRSRTLPGSFGETVAFYGEKLLVQRPDGSLQIWSADASRLIKVIAGMALRRCRAGGRSSRTGRENRPRWFGRGRRPEFRCDAGNHLPPSGP